MSTNGSAPEHDHSTMTSEELRQHNIGQLAYGIRDLTIRNQQRLPLAKENVQAWTELQFEMLSMKLDMILGQLLLSNAIDPEVTNLEYQLGFLVRLSKHLDELFPDFVFQTEGEE